MTVKDFRKLLDKMADDAKVTIWTKNNNFIYDDVVAVKGTDDNLWICTGEDNLAFNIMDEDIEEDACEDIISHFRSCHNTDKLFNENGERISVNQLLTSMRIRRREDKSNT